MVEALTDSLEQLEGDLEAAQKEVKDAEKAHEKTKANHRTLGQTLKDQQVRSDFVLAADMQGDYAAAEEKLRAEKAVLVAFDTELSDLEHDLKAKKQEIVDPELSLKKLEHDIGLVAKEKASAEALQENLEKQFTWITDEHQ
jgi:structural maintenance of chromosome 2